MTNYKFQSEDEYQLWCQNTITGIYYANIAMNNEKIRDAVQEIARTLHRSEGEQLVKPGPQTYIVYYSKGAYDAYTECTFPFKYNGTLNELVDELTSKQEAYIKGYEKHSHMADYKERHKLNITLANECTIVGAEYDFCVSSLYDFDAKNKKAYFSVQRLCDWIDNGGSQ